MPRSQLISVEPPESHANISDLGTLTLEAAADFALSGLAEHARDRRHHQPSQGTKW